MARYRIAGRRPLRRRARARRRWPVQPVALAVAADAADFETLRRHGLFDEADYGGYLRRTEGRLRAMHGHGLAVHLRLFEPVDFAEFCAAHLLDPADQVAQVAYAADPELAGEPFVYAGQRLGELLPQLLDDHLARVRISIACAVLLAEAGRAERPEARLAAVLQYVAELYLALAAGAGDGAHQVTLRWSGKPEGVELAAQAALWVEAGRLSVAGRDAEAFCVTLAAALAAPGRGELLLHRALGPGWYELHGWTLAGGPPQPMSAVETLALHAQVPDADRSGAERVTARPGFPLPDPPPEGGRAGPDG